jgi:fatty-acyl-CoA synthase
MKPAPATRRQEALVVRHQNVRLSYAELRLKVDALACGLRRLGLAPGERIGIWSQNNHEWALTQFATAKAGLVLVNINPAYRRSELEYALNKVGCRALILSPAFKSSDYLAMLADLAPELAHCEPGLLRAHRLPSLEIVIRLGAEQPRHAQLRRPARPPGRDELAELAELGERLQFDDPINIQFTSGTTGNPKGATLSHRNILNNGFFVGEAIRLREGDRVHPGAALPLLRHGDGQPGLPHPRRDDGLSGRGFEPLAAAGRGRGALHRLHGVPTMFIAQLDHPDFAASTCPACAPASWPAPCPIEVMKRVIDEMHMGEVTIAYGMTETSGELPERHRRPIERVSTVGRVQPHCEVKIVDPAASCPRHPGELCTRGYSVMLGYWGDEAKTAEAIDAAGWMHTGDLATIDDEGYCNIVGRIKDMVIRGGENIYPREIEEFLYRHPKVQDVQVVGVPDQYGEELCAWIIVRRAAPERGRGARLPGPDRPLQDPRYISFVDSFPMTVTGKIQKFQIREKMKQTLGLGFGHGLKETP